jgi:hypothetical protein
VEDGVRNGHGKIENDVVRYFITEPLGQVLDFSKSDTVVFGKEFSCEGYDKEQMKLVAFVQNFSSKEILTARTTRISHRIVCPKPIRKLSPNSSTIFKIGIRNSIPDSTVIFVVDDFEKTGPNTDCEIELQYPTETDSVAGKLVHILKLNGEQSDSLRIKVTSNSQPGTAKFNIKVYPEETPTRIMIQTISVSVIDRKTILIIDDDGFQNYESYYHDMMPADFPFATWEREWQPVNLDMLQSAAGVIWLTGWAFPTLDEDDRNVIGEYLDQGGRFFISGQDIGWELCDSTSIMYDPFGSTTQFYEDYLGAKYIADSTNWEYVYTSMDTCSTNTIDSMSMALDSMALSMVDTI